MSRRSSLPNAQEPQGSGRQGESFDPSGPHGGFGGAGGSQGSVYSDGEVHSRGPSQQRREHEALRQGTAQERHGDVESGGQGPYGDYGELQDHHGGYWYGGQDGAGKKPCAPSSSKRR